MSFFYLIVFLMSFLSGIILIALFKKLSLKFKILTSKGIPLIGGVGMGLSFILTSFGLWHTTSIIFPALLILIFGIIDDWRQLTVSAKLFVQIIATALLIHSGIKTHIVFLPDYLNIIITFLWVIGITNAFNLLDIMDGLAATVAIIAGVSFMLISFVNADSNTLFLSLILVGSAISFLIYNLPPAKIYMGNSGSHFLGFILASIALSTHYASLETKVALFAPFLILGLPILDTLFLILMRLKQKKVPFKKSNDHLALRFLALGYSKKKTLLIMLILGGLFSLCGIILTKASSFLSAIIVIFIFLTGLAVSQRMGKVVVND